MNFLELMAKQAEAESYFYADPISFDFGADEPPTVKYSDPPLFAPGVNPLEALRRAFDERTGIRAKHHVTVRLPEHAQWILWGLRDRIRDKVVVEIGAGIGVLAIEMAKIAKHVFAIEADPAFAWVFCEELYKTKPDNLTWIFDKAENLVDVVRADVAVVVTGSDEVALRELAGRFAPEVHLPWQDGNGGKALIR